MDCYDFLPCLETEGLSAFAQVLHEFGHGAQETLDSFAKGFATNPHHALGWSESAFDAAARSQLAHRWLRVHTARPDEATLEAAIEELEDEVLRGARNGTHRSTGHATNALSEADLKAAGDLLHRLRRLARRGGDL